MFENAKGYSSAGRLELPTFRLTAERANQLRHADDKQWPTICAVDDINWLDDLAMITTAPD